MEIAEEFTGDYAIYGSYGLGAYLRILAFRCPECRKRIMAAGYMREPAAAENGGR